MSVNKNKLIFVLAVFVVLGIVYVSAVQMKVNDNNLFVGSNGNVGIGTATPGQKLTVAGIVESTSGGFKFPDGTTQTTASGGGSQWTTSGSNIYYNGGVGINTATPTGAELEVVDGNANNDVRIGLRSSATSTGQLGVSGTQMFLNSPNNLPILFYVGPERMRIDSNGNVGIGRTPVTFPLEVQGNAGKTDGGNTWATISDARFKNVNGEIKNALGIIDKLEPVTYTWNELHNTKYGKEEGVKYGFTAQNVQEVIPEFVTKDKEGFLWYNPSGYEAILTKAIQEQQKQIEELEQRIEKLEQRRIN